jgi:hypothetical protein
MTDFASMLGVVRNTWQYRMAGKLVRETVHRPAETKSLLVNGVEPEIFLQTEIFGNCSAQRTKRVSICLAENWVSKP